MAFNRSSFNETGPSKLACMPASNLSQLSPQYRKTVTIWFSITTLIVISGAIANLLALLVILKHKKLRSGSGILIINMIFIYFLLCILHFPVGSLMVMDKVYHLDLFQGQCQYVHFFYIGTMIAGNYADATLALNRLVAICFPLHYNPWTSKKVIWLMTVFSWFIGLCFALYTFFVGNITAVPSPTGLCSFRYSKPTEAWTLTVVMTYIPYCFIGTSSIAILFKMICIKVKRQTQISAEFGAITKRSKLLFQRRLAIGRMLLASFVWCFMCSMPTVIVVSLQSNIRSADPLIGLWLRALLICQYSVNPVIFFTLNADYRRGINSLWRQCWKEPASNHAKMRREGF